MSSRIARTPAVTAHLPKESVPTEVFGLEIFGLARNHWKIYVVHGEYTSHRDRKHGHFLVFEEEGDKKIVTCYNMKGTEVWKTEINNTKTLSQCAIDHFKNLLAEHHTKIKKLVFCGRFFEGIDFGIRSLESLEDLEIDGNADIQQFFFPNSASPLKKLSVRGIDNVLALRNYEEIFEVKDLINAPGLKLSIEDVVKLTAFHVHISIGDITPEQIVAFLKSWQKSTTLKLYGKYQWVINIPNFSVERLFELLDVYDPYVFERDTNIAHDNRTQKPAKLSYSDNVLKFSWDHRPPPMTAHQRMMMDFLARIGRAEAPF